MSKGGIIQTWYHLEHLAGTKLRTLLHYCAPRVRDLTFHSVRSVQVNSSSLWRCPVAFSALRSCRALARTGMQQYGRTLVVWWCSSLGFKEPQVRSSRRCCCCCFFFFFFFFLAARPTCVTCSSFGCRAPLVNKSESNRNQFPRMSPR